MEVPQHTCGDERRTCGSQFSPTVWVPGIELSSLGGTCFYWLSHLAPYQLFDVGEVT